MESRQEEVGEELALTIEREDGCEPYSPAG